MTTSSPPYIVSPKTHHAPKARHPITTSTNTTIANYSSLDQTIQSRTATPSRSSSPVPPLEDLVYDCFLHSIGKLQDPSRIKMAQEFTHYAAKTHITENLDFLVSLHEYQSWLDQGHEESEHCYENLVTSLSDLNISHQIFQDIRNSQDRTPLVFAKAKKQIMQLLMENCTEFGSYIRKKIREELQLQTPQDSPNLSPISPPFSPPFSPTELRSNPSSIPRTKPRNITAAVSNGTRSINNSNPNSADVSSPSSVSSTASFLGQLKLGKEPTATTSSTTSTSTSSSSLKFWSRKK
ncbi:hypothetical protein Cantr_10547 [Candida viswanathii]|uniref:RGS domain-containing protein n=1 Tax=Candida viswanathii TaxID=5486 RepID=A0A367YDB5_9ASCO|nr:hypothetical protein Cantr_10547 [Candida viswanathii]